MDGGRPEQINNNDYKCTATVVSLGIPERRTDEATSIVWFAVHTAARAMVVWAIVTIFFGKIYGPIAI